MTFSVLHQKKETVGTLEDSLQHMCTLGAVLALYAEETGLHFSMMRLRPSESLLLEDKKGIEIKVTRVT